jgi:hypothetical protein
VTVDRERLAAAIERERDLAARGIKRGREPSRPAPTPAPPVLTDLDRRLLDVLAAHQGPGGIYPTVGRLAGVVGCSRRHARRRLAELESAGLVERVAVHERPDDAEWTRRGRPSQGPGRQTSNSYRLTGRPLGHGPPGPLGHGAGAEVGHVLGPPDMAKTVSAAQPLGHGQGHVLPRTVKEAEAVSKGSPQQLFMLDPIESTRPPESFSR